MVVTISTRTAGVPGIVDCGEPGAVGVDVDPPHPAAAATTASTHARNTTRTVQVYALIAVEYPRTYRISAVMLLSTRTRWVVVVFTWFVAIYGALAQSPAFDPQLFSALHWRLIGPFRAGRVTSVAGVAGDPNTYYFGTPGGGVWKTTTAGVVWRPIFDREPVSSIGAIAVAPSNPNVLYVGTGERTAGNGVYKSTDAGVSWTHAGLADARFINGIVVDPRDADVAIVGVNAIGYAIIWKPVPAWAVTGTRGVFKTTDGGRSWKQVLKDDRTAGVVDLCSDPDDPRTLYAVLYVPASGTGESAVAATSEILKSTDQGSTWTPLRAQGLPEKARGRVGLAVAPREGGRRLYAVADQGFFRSDDGGASWQQSTKDPRVVASEYFSRVFVDPRNADVIYVAQTSLYRSTDGGRTFEAYVGAPSGDDIHVMWIDPGDSKRMMLGVDQGAIVSVDGGGTWTSWYNQPTGEFYHVSVDNAFPYHVYGAQQDSGTAAVASRSDYGQIADRDWMPIGGFEFCYIAPDPSNENLVYSGGWYGTVVRFDKTTKQVATVFERGEKYRTANMAPLMFSPKDPRALYFGTQLVLKTTDGGGTWNEISPDLTGYVKEDGESKPGAEPPPAITALAASPLDAGTVWAGTSDRIVQLTRDGGATWQNVSPSGLRAPTRILTLEASHHDPAEAFASVGATRESTEPHTVRTRDYGRTWQLIVNGIPPTDMVNVVREDPTRKGLLFAGTTRGVFVSFDDGERWQTLQLDLPVAVVTDLAIHGNDLIASTYGRAMWILDDITPIRAMTREVANTDVHLLAPAAAVRVRWDNWPDTPLPREMPAGENPPDGAAIDYVLASRPATPITMTIYDERGAIVRQFSSDAQPPDVPPPNVPEYWFAPADRLPASAGLNRFVWDLRYPPPKAIPYGYSGTLLQYTEYTLPDHAVPGRTPRLQPPGPLAVPGMYTIDLSAGGKRVRQPLTITLDPRVHAANTDLQAQLDVEQQIARGLSASYRAYYEADALRNALADRKRALTPKQKAMQDAAASIEKKIASVMEGTRAAPGVGPVNRDLLRLATSVQSADARPATTARNAIDEKCKALDASLALWRTTNEQDVARLNNELTKQRLGAVPLAKADVTGCR